MESAAPPVTPAERARRTRITALIVACALFMQNLDSTVISTALPTMARAFGAQPAHMNVALTSYLLSLAVFIPASGWMADRFGARTVFRAAIGVFTLGSILCGRADSLTFLVMARIFQGLGGAMMVPVGRLLLLRSVAKSELVMPFESKLKSSGAVRTPRFDGGWIHCQEGDLAGDQVSGTLANSPTPPGGDTASLSTLDLDCAKIDHDNASCSAVVFFCQGQRP